jgi:hypothetical protein
MRHNNSSLLLIDASCSDPARQLRTKSATSSSSRSLLEAPGEIPAVVAQDDDEIRQIEHAQL